MLSGLLKNDIAVQVSINIMNTFVEMRKFVTCKNIASILKYNTPRVLEMCTFSKLFEVELVFL